MGKIKNTRSGLTLIELILSIAIIGMIIVAFMPLFVMSTKTNSKSESTLNATYLGKDAMELAYYLSQNISYKDLDDELLSRGYVKDELENTYNYEYNDKKYLNIKFTEEGDLIRVIVKIYKDKDTNEIEAQYESIYPWVGRGILDEK